MTTIIDGNQVTKAGNNLKNYAAQIDIKIKAINGILDQIDKAWDGDDKKKYLSDMQTNYIKPLTNLKELIEKSGTFLIKTSSAYAELDRVFSGKGISV